MSTQITLAQRQAIVAESDPNVIETTAYHSRPELNWSRLKSGAVSAKHLKQVLESPPKPATAAMELGTAIHCAVLEPERFAREVVIAPEAFVTGSGGLSTAKDAKAWRAGLAPDAMVLTQQQYDNCVAARENVMAHEDARLWLESSDLIEHEAFWTETVDAAGESLAVDCRMKADAVSRKLGLLWDLKSIGTGMAPLSVDRCVREIASRLYHGQLGYYTRGFAKNGIDISAVGWIFVESSAPFDVVVIQADADMMTKGYDLAEKLLRRYATAKVTGRWPGVAERAVVVSLPKWGNAQVDESADELAAWGI